MQLEVCWLCDNELTTTREHIVREHRRRTKEMFVPLSHPPGHAQCDFGEALVVISGVEQKAHCFVLDPPHSDGCFVKTHLGADGSRVKQYQSSMRGRDQMTKSGLQTITICRLCGRQYSTQGIGTHLRTCIPRMAGAPENLADTIHLTVSAGQYRLELALQETCTFGDLDRFLKKIWLECCRHLSLFVINQREFRRKKSLLGQVSQPGMKFQHVYDLGASSVMEVTENPRRPGLFETLQDGFTMPRCPRIRIIARNLIPELCACGKVAELITQLDLEELYAQDQEAINRQLDEWEPQAYCRECGPAREDLSEDLRDLVNSPRDGYECFDESMIRDEVRLTARTG